MRGVNFISRFLVVAAIAAAGMVVHATASAATLTVHCGQKEGITSIGAAIKLLQAHPLLDASNTINVSGNCQENVVIQSLERLTLNAVDGASVSDASGGTLDVIYIDDSRDVSVNGFTVNAGSGSGANNGISCSDYSLCRLSGNTIQGAGNGGFAVFAISNATVDGDLLQNNAFAGLLIRSGSTVRSGGQNRPITARGNGQGINMARQAYANVGVLIQNNSNVGAHAMFNSTMELTGTISGNGSAGAYVHEGSTVRLTNATITGNAGAGVIVQDLSMVSFNGGSVSGNGGIDVACNPLYPVTRGVAGTGGTTNCVEP
jgi:hypothetical protein